MTSPSHASSPAGHRAARARALLRRAGPAVAVLVFVLAAVQLRRSFAGLHLAELTEALQHLDARPVIAAAVLTCLNYLCATCYDLAGMRNLGRHVPWSRVVPTALLANTLSNSLGNGLITGTAVRYWHYTRAGLSGTDVAHLVLFSTSTFWLGFLLLAGTVLLGMPGALPAGWSLGGLSQPAFGIVCMAGLGAYAAMVLLHRMRPLARIPLLRSLRLPSPGLAVLQTVLGAVDLLLMASVFGVLVHAHGVPFTTSLLVILAGVVAGNVSSVPGGLGVFESVAVLLIGSTVPAATLAADLLTYRLVYFVAPLAVTPLLALRMGSNRPAPRMR